MVAKKPSSKFGSIKATPLFQGETGLSFDNVASEEVIELTDEQKASRFLSKYQELVDPFVTYREYFEASAKGSGWDLKDVKTQYIKLVLSGKWPEAKYVTVINDIFEHGAVFSPLVLDTRGRMYEQQALASQRRSASTRRRGRV